MTFIPDAQQKPRKYRRRALQPYAVRQPLMPSYAIPEEQEDHDETIRLLKRIARLLDRGYVDQTYALSNTESTLFLDYKGRKHIYMYSPVAITLNLNDLGTMSVPALTWTDISFRETMQIFTTNQPNAVFVNVRATDDLILPPSLPLANPLPVDGTGTLITSYPAPGGPFPVDLINLDVSGYKELAFQFSGGDNNIVTFNASLNGTIYAPLTCTRVSYLTNPPTLAYAEQIAASDVNVWSAPITFRFIKLTYNGATAPAVTLWRSKESGLLRVVNTASTMVTSTYLIGYIRNYGVQRIDQAAGQATDRNLLLSNGILGTVSITTTGAAALTIYDTSTIPVPGGAVPIFALPANQPLGPVEAFGIQFFNGLSIKGNAGNPGFSVMWDLPHN